MERQIIPITFENFATHPQVRENQLYLLPDAVAIWWHGGNRNIAVFALGRFSLMKGEISGLAVSHYPEGSGDWLGAHSVTFSPTRQLLATDVGMEVDGFESAIYGVRNHTRIASYLATGGVRGAKALAQAEAPR